MSRGKGIHGNSDGLETSLAELYGGIKQQIIFYAAEVGISAGWVAERISSLLSPERAGVLHHLSIMRVETPTGSRGMEPLALAVNAHSSETPSTVVGTTSEVADHPVKPKKASGYWGKMTPKQRSAEMKRRLQMSNGKAEPKQKRDSNAARKRKKAAEKAAKLAAAKEAARKLKDAKRHRELRAERKTQQGVEIGRNGRPKLSPEERAKKQKIYVQRSILRAQGVPDNQLPPLPGTNSVNAVAN